jgi:hypothetical protein
MTYSELKAIISDAKRQARALAGTEYRCARSRGAEVVADFLDGSDMFKEAFLTKKALNAFIADATSKKACIISLQGGYDGADSVRDLNEYNYDPLVSEWCFEIWRAGCGFIHADAIDIKVA